MQNIKIAFCVLSICLSNCGLLNAQKLIRLNHGNQVDGRTYSNLYGAHLYVFINNDSRFISKLGELDFHISKDLDSIIINDSSKNVFFKVRSRKFDYIVKLNKKIYNDYSKYQLAIFKKCGKTFYEVSFLESHGDGFIAPIINVTQNIEW